MKIPAMIRNLRWLGVGRMKGFVTPLVSNLPKRLTTRGLALGESLLGGLLGGLYEAHLLEFAADDGHCIQTQPRLQHR